MFDDPASADRHAAPPLVDEFNALPVGTRFGALEVLRTIGVGGFGIVYLAQDHALERRVAIKEYMPGQLARRGDGSLVSVRSGSLLETFELGRKSFVNEARLLARFDHRSLLKVYQFWEANGTAYMAMPYLQGQTLKQVRQAMSRSPDEAWMLRLLLPLIDGLTLLHAESVFHRDIAPDNILLPTDGADPILLDFGAARRVIGDRTQTFTAILKPSYAPIEQYAESAGLKQGAWTDVYALGAVMYYLVLGHTPPPATTRAISDDCLPLAGLDLPGLSPHFLAAIDWALAVRPADRPQSMAELRAALTGERSAPVSFELPALATPVDRQLDLGHVIPGEPRFEATQLMAKAAAPAKAARSPLKPVALIAGVFVLAAAGWWLNRAPTLVPVPDPVGVATQVPPPIEPAGSATAAERVVTSPPLEASSAPAKATPKPAVARVTVGTPPLAEKRPPPRETSAPPAMPRQDASLTLPTPPAEVALPQAAPALAAAAPASQPLVAAIEINDPREACGGEIFLFKAICIDRECKKPAFAKHPECAKLRDIEERRQRRNDR